jgi:hypothetical protein
MLTIASLLSVITAVPLFVGYLGILGAPLIFLVIGGAIIFYWFGKKVDYDKAA